MAAYDRNAALQTSYNLRSFAWAYLYLLRYMCVYLFVCIHTGKDKCKYGQNLSISLLKIKCLLWHLAHGKTKKNFSIGFVSMRQFCLLCTLLQLRILIFVVYSIHKINDLKYSLIVWCRSTIKRSYTHTHRQIYSYDFIIIVLIVYSIGGSGSNSSHYIHT